MKPHVGPGCRHWTFTSERNRVTRLRVGTTVSCLQSTLGLGWHAVQAAKPCRPQPASWTRRAAGRCASAQIHGLGVRGQIRAHQSWKVQEPGAPVS